MTLNACSRVTDVGFTAVAATARDVHFMTCALPSAHLLTPTQHNLPFSSLSTC